MPARRTVAVLVAALAVIVGPIVLAAPASAAGPDTTALLGPVTFPDPTNEQGPMTATAECGTNATSGLFAYENVTTGDTGVYNISLDGNQQGVFSEDPTNNIGDPGDEVTVELQCFNGPVLLATSASQTVTLTDLGALISVADVEVDQSIPISGSCGLVPVDWAVAILLYPGITSEEQIVFVSIPVDVDGLYAFTFPSAASAGFSVGSAIVQVICGVGPAPVLPDFPDEESLVTIRSAEFQVLPKTLPATGALLPTAPIALAAFALLGGGAILVGARRRQTS